MGRSLGAVEQIFLVRNSIWVNEQQMNWKTQGNITQGLYEFRYGNSRHVQDFQEPRILNILEGSMRLLSLNLETESSAEGDFGTPKQIPQYYQWWEG